MKINNIEKEIEYLLHTLDAPVTAKRITAILCPPYSPNKCESIEKSLEKLCNANKVTKKKCQFIEDAGWQIAGDLPDNLLICNHTLKDLLKKKVNIDRFKKHILYSFIISSPFPVTKNRIDLFLLEKDFQEFLYEDKIVEYISIFENEFKIKKVKIEGFGVPAWRKYDPAVDTIIEKVISDSPKQKKIVKAITSTPDITQKYDNKNLKKNYFFSEDKSILFIDIFNITDQDNIFLTKIIKKHLGDCIIVNFNKIQKKITLNDIQAFVLSKAKNLYRSSKYDCIDIESYIESFPYTPGHLKLARQLIKSRNNDRCIYFNFLTEISDEVAEIFSRFNGGLLMPSVKKLSDRAAEFLSNLKDPAEGISETKWWDLYINGLLNLELSGLEELSDSAGHIKLAKMLARQNTLTLPQLVKVSPQSAAALALHGGPLQFDGMKKISNKSAEQLSRCTGDLIMPAIEGLSDSDGHINLGIKLLKREYDDNGDAKQDLDKDEYNDEDENEDYSLCSVSKIFKKITPALLKNSFISNLNIYIRDSIIEEKLADALCAHRGKIQLCGLEELTESTCHINLSQRLAFQETVYLNKLKKISFSSAAALSEALELYLDGLQQINARLSSVLSKNVGILSLKGISMLSNDSSIELSNHNGFLFLNGLASLTSSEGHLALAKKLSLQDLIELEGLTKISNKAAVLLCDCDGPIHLPYKILGDSDEHLMLRRKISAQKDRRSHLF
jgi:hypothetical protein